MQIDGCDVMNKPNCPFKFDHSACPECVVYTLELIDSFANWFPLEQKRVTIVDSVIYFLCLRVPESRRVTRRGSIT
ncbi:hypothetical protein TNCT_603291 [Trichonephila clavata]|uniref:Uncharacterized protein n=1 Tax=Trichonephila clavata TaxID=2740835 RepID=A0A8X6H803_TRICU|nr:hypothetical protein TNCT_603291 [Trichonephila clavata]